MCNSFNRKTQLLWKVHTADIEETILDRCPISEEKIIDENGGENCEKNRYVTPARKMKSLRGNHVG